jgi:hypothetical protein
MHSSSSFPPLLASPMKDAQHCLMALAGPSLTSHNFRMPSMPALRTHIKPAKDSNSLSIKDLEAACGSLAPAAIKRASKLPPRPGVFGEKQENEGQWTKGFSTSSLQGRQKKEKAVLLVGKRKMRLVENIEKESNLA